MSDLGILLQANGQDPDRTTIGAHQFAHVTYAYMCDWITGAQALTDLNTILASNDQPELTTQERNDAAAIKTHFNGLATDRLQLEFFETLHWATMRLEEGFMTVADWDTRVGL